MLEPGVRVRPRCLEAVHSRFRGAQVVSDSLAAPAVCSEKHSNRFWVPKSARVGAPGSPHPLSYLIGMFFSCVRLTVLVSWMVPFRDAKENLVTNRDDPFAIGQRCAANTLTFRAHGPIPHNPC